MTGIRLSVPKTATQGEIIELKALIQHPMESGFRRGPTGQVIARNIISTFECRYNGETIFEAEFNPAVSANPFLSFFTTATESGAIEFRWTGQDGEIYSDTANITVT